MVVLGAVLLQPLAITAATIDDAKAEALGIQKLPGGRLTLYTDLSGDEIDRLPEVFSQAFPQWCEYFGVKEGGLADWRMTGFLMKDKVRSTHPTKSPFVVAGLLPEELPPFKHGFSRDHELWLYDQPSDYYRRHLLLHEGTHGFMNTVLGGCGPPWYMEGMAEYLATHRWRDGRLTLGYMPKNRNETPEWGRVRIIQDAVAERKALRLPQVIGFPKSRRGDTDFYAWCWAAATLLDRHPRYQERFRHLAEFVQQPDFNERFFRLFEADWQELCEEWQLMVTNLEYGYDVARSAVDFSPGKALPADGAAVTIAADRGWQNTGLRLEAGVAYRLTATGRYQVAFNSPLPLGEGPGVRAADSEQPTVWWSEPNGVSIRYYQGRPLGVLLAAVRPDHPPKGSASALLHPTVIGLGTTLAPKETGTLYLKINDSAGELDDNTGELKVEVRRE